MATRKDLLLQCIYDIGGQGTRKQINEKIRDYWVITDEELQIEKGTNTPLYWHRVASSSQQLKDKNGYLDNPERGTWRITEKGKDYLNRKQRNIGQPLLDQSEESPSGNNESSMIRIKEEEFYKPFSDWIKKLGECTRAIPLGGKIFKDKWGTPDIIGIREPRRGALIKPPTEITSAEIKVETNDLITAFGQACAYKLFCHKSYIVIPNKSADDDIDRLDALSRIFGIGLILFDNESVDNPKFEIRVRAVRHEPDMMYIDKYLRLVEKELFPN